MSKILTIAVREYRAMIATKGFLIGLAIVPIMFLGGMVIPQLIGKSVDLSDRKVAVIDHSSTLTPILEKAAESYNQLAIFTKSDDAEGTKKQIQGKIVIESVVADTIDDNKRLELSDRVRKRDLHAFLEIAATVYGPPTAEPPVTYHSENSAMSDIRRWVEATLTAEVQRQRIEKAGLDSQMVKSVMIPVAVDGRGLLTKSTTGDGGVKKAEKSNAMESIFVPMGCMMLMFMLIFMALQPMLECVLEEKQQRVGEVLFGCVNSTQLMAGKLLGNVSGSLTVFAIYGTAGFIVANYNDVIDKIPWRVVPWFILFQICAVLMYSAVTMAMASAASNLQEVQGYMMLVWMPLIVPMFVWLPVVQNPNGKMAIWMSFFPPASPLVMVLRVAATASIPAYQVGLAVLLTLTCTSIAVYAAGRIFRIGMLMQGKAPKITELVRWIWAS